MADLRFWLSIAMGLFVPLYIYVRTNDAKIGPLHPAVLTHSPERWTPESVRRTAAEIRTKLKGSTSGSLIAPEELPPKTGRRYIITGGAGFLGGWIVLHLIARGEDPRRIRIVDIRRPVRRDLLEGPAAQVGFCKADVSSAASVEEAFSKPWPDTDEGPEPEITVFHTAAIIRFYERAEHLQPFSDGVNVKGTENVIAAARKIGATTLVYTSSGSVAVRGNRFLRWPWEGSVPLAVQVITGSDAQVPKAHRHFFSNYAVSKWKAEKLVRAANGTSSGRRVLRTGCIRPGNGIYGPGGDLMVDQYLVRKSNPSWIFNICQSFVHVENVSLAHLCYEARLIEASRGAAQPDVGGGSFVVADAGPPPTYSDVYRALVLLTDGAVTFTELSPTAMLLFATLVERYYLARFALLRAAPGLAKFLPAIAGDIVFLQPSIFNLTQVHLIFDDSRARASPEKGGLSYNGHITTIEGTCQVVAERQRNGGGLTQPRLIVPGHQTPGHGFDITRAEKGVEEVIEKLGLTSSDRPQVAAKLEY